MSTFRAGKSSRGCALESILRAPGDDFISSRLISSGHNKRPADIWLMAIIIVGVVLVSCDDHTIHRNHPTKRKNMAIKSFV